MKVLIAGGGTAGHVNPALALAEALDGDEVVFVGTERGVESRLVREAGRAFEPIEVRGFDRSKPWTFPVTGLRAVGAVAACRSIVRRLDADVVVGMGGYVSLPACIAARTSGRPVVLHEQNIVLGLANRTTRRLAERVAVSFEETLVEVGRKGVWTGNPVSSSLLSLDHAPARTTALERFDMDAGRKTLLVFGGSLGAQRVNEAAAGLATLWRDRSDVQILHITGASQFETVRSTVAAAGTSPAGLIYRCTAYVERMGEAYALADLALCRGGATTVAELTIVGLPSVIVPYPHHRDRQQERHGRVLERAGAARVLPDSGTTPESVAAEVGALIGDGARLSSMAAATRKLGRPDAASRLAHVVRETAA